MRQHPNLLRRFASSLPNRLTWPLLGALGLIALVAILLLTNPLHLDQWLMGWDNINPELNLGLNIKRAIFAVWQEYQGVGVVGGMGHASDLPRLAIFWILSWITPINLLRPLWVVGMLILGVVGVYVLLVRRILPSLFPSASTKTLSLAAFAGGLYALGNLATLQMFRTPFEPFVTHFGFLPWLLMLAIDMIRGPSRKTACLFILLSFFAAPQGYVQTVFLVYAMILGILSLGLFFHKPSRTSLLRILAVWTITIATNAFWLLPFGYFVTHNSYVPVEAKINEMSTGEVYLRNKAFGTLWDTVLLKGFWFDTFDLDTQKNQIVPVLSPWRSYAEQPIQQLVLAGGFAVATFGAFYLLIKQKRAWWWLPGAFLLVITMLTVDTPPFSWVNEWLSRVPLFHQAYRFRFTKFSLAAGIIYSTLFGIGLAALIQKASHYVRHIFSIVLIVLLLSFGIIMYPAIQGSFWYDPIKLTLPADYDEFFSFMKTQPFGRIANLPQPTFWGWSYYRWGYTGWGFLWYGMEQPIMDRAFDPWSRMNENYYWQLSLALYRKDPSALSRVLDRYDITYILVDKNVISASHNRALFTQETEETIANIPSFRLDKTFGNLQVYSRSTPESQNFISVRGALPQAGPAYEWSDTDTAYDELGDYITGDQGYLYSNRSLFTKRDLLTSPPVAIDEKNLVFDTSASSALSANSVLNNQAVIQCGVLNSGTIQSEIIGENALRLTSNDGRICISFSLGLLPHIEGYVVTVESRHIAGRPLLFSLINQTAQHTEVETYLPGINNEQTTSYFVLPPLAPDGLGYSVYLSNDAIGKQTTTNDIERIRVYKIPYRELIGERTAPPAPAPQEESIPNFSVDHPNPAYYLAKLDPASQGKDAPLTLILNQAYDPGWRAFERTSTFPFLRPLGNHVMVNNWANGWLLPGRKQVVVLFFLPQLWEFIGFALLPVPFLFLMRRSRATS